VQVDEEISTIPSKVEQGVAPTLRRLSLHDYAAGARVAAPTEYPTRVVCWSASRRGFVALDVPGAAPSERWGEAMQRAFHAAPCAQRTAGV
jgi:hypothetical protein